MSQQRKTFYKISLGELTIEITTKTSFQENINSTEPHPRSNNDDNNINYCCRNYRFRSRNANTYNRCYRANSNTEANNFRSNDVNAYPTNGSTRASTEQQSSTSYSTNNNFRRNNDNGNNIENTHNNARRSELIKERIKQLRNIRYQRYLQAKNADITKIDESITQQNTRSYSTSNINLRRNFDDANNDDANNDDANNDDANNDDSYNDDAYNDDAYNDDAYNDNGNNIENTHNNARRSELIKERIKQLRNIRYQRYLQAKNAAITKIDQSITQQNTRSYSTSNINLIRNFDDANNDDAYNDNANNDNANNIIDNNVTKYALSS